MVRMTIKLVLYQRFTLTIGNKQNQKLEEVGGDFKSNYDYTFAVSSGLEVKAQSLKDGDGSL